MSLSDFTVVCAWLAIDFGFGFYDWHPGNFPFDVYYDDIVLDTKRVGCL